MAQEQHTQAMSAADRFARWLEDGPKLADAAGCYVEIRVRSAKSKHDAPISKVKRVKEEA